MSVIENPDSLPLADLPVSNPHNEKITIIDPVGLITNSTSAAENQNKALIILNQEIRIDLETFMGLWKSSGLRICADGGSNRLLDYTNKWKDSVTEGEQLTDLFIPDYIVGDMDSMEPETKEYYSSDKLKKKVVFKAQVSQYYSDLDKSISLTNLYFFNHENNQHSDEASNSNLFDLSLESYDDHDGISRIEEKLLVSSKSTTSQVKPKGKTVVFLVGGIGGRFDQTIHTLSQLIKCEFRRPNLKFVMWNNEYSELILMVTPGFNFVKIGQPENRKPGSRTIGMLPLVGESVLTSYGLKWDVKDWSSSLSTNVSSCNRVACDEGFYVITNKTIFVNLEL